MDFASWFAILSGVVYLGWYFTRLVKGKTVF